MTDTEIKNIKTEADNYIKKYGNFGAAVAHERLEESVMAFDGDISRPYTLATILLYAEQMAFEMGLSDYRPFMANAKGEDYNLPSKFFGLNKSAVLKNYEDFINRK